MKRMVMSFFVVLSLLLTGCASNPQPSSDSGSEKTEAKKGEENLGPFTVYPKDGVIEAPMFGIKITLPESMKDYSLVFTGLVQSHYSYARLAILNEDDVNASGDLLDIVAYPKAVEASKLVADAQGFSEDEVHDLGANDALHYYAMSVADVDMEKSEPLQQFVNSLSEEKREVYFEALTHANEIIEGIEITDLVLPKPPQAADIESKALLDMKVTDLDGNEVRLGDIIENNKVTLLNFWGTFCGPCVTELPWLQSLSEKYADQGFAIVGLCVDIVDTDGEVDEEVLATAKEIVKSTGVQYPVVMASREILDFVKMPCSPTSYFLDSEGNTIGDPVLGGQAESSWDETIVEKLEAVK